MAMIFCPECRAEISDQAPACPRCGLPKYGAQYGAAPPSRAYQHPVAPFRAVTPPQAKPFDWAPIIKSVRRVPVWALVACGFVTISITVVVIALASTSEERGIAASQKDFVAKNCPGLTSFSACEAKLAQIKTDEARVAQEKLDAIQRIAREAAEKDRAETTARHAAYLATMTPAEREEEVRICGVSNVCKQEEADAIIATGTTEKERAHLTLVSFGAAAESAAALGGHDGTALSANAVASVARLVGQHGKAMLDVMPKVSAGEARKDSGDARGKVVKAGGTVVDIHEEGGFFEGTFALDDGSVAYFVTPLPTPGVFAGSWASYRGVFVQEYAYANVSGGQTRALLLVGGFN